MKVLVIQHKMIGDVLTSSLLFELLRKEYPNAQLDYLINQNTLAVVQENPFIDSIWVYTPTMDKNKAERTLFNQQIKKQNYTHIIDVYAKLRSAKMTFLLRPKQSVSYHKWYTQFAYSKTVKPLKETPKQEGLAIVNRVLLLEALGVKSTSIPKPKIYLSKDELSTAKALISSKNIDKSRPLFMIGVLGSSENKTYPLPYLAQVLDALVAKTNAHLVLNYIPSQKPLISQLLGYCNAKTVANIHLDIYGTDLRGFLAITAQCDALIGNEGGAVNMAKALNIPTFAIYAPWILKSAWNSYEQDGFNKSIHLADIHPESYTKHAKKYKKQTAELYKKLTPKAVITALDQFLKHHNFTG